MIRSDIAAMAIDLGRAKPLFDQDRERFRQFLTAQARVPRPAAAVMIDRRSAASIEQADIAGQPAVRAADRPSALADVSDTEPQVALLPETDNVAGDHQAARLRRHLSLRRAPARSAVIAQLAGDAGERRRISPTCEQRRVGVQVAFALMYTVIALIVLLSAVWIGLNFANRLVAPIRRLIGAADLVSTGNLYVQVPVRRVGGRSRPARRDLQQDDAGAAHAARRPHARARPDRQPPPLHRSGAGRRERRRDRRRRRRQHQHPQPLGREADRAGRSGSARPPLAEVVPELAELFDEAALGGAAPRAGPDHDQPRAAASAISRCASPPSSPRRAEHGYVVTLDDITDLVTAQRTSAWADVARRIAHEIKNPLTPIQLSAERLQAANTARSSSRTATSSSSAPTRSCARSTTSSAWSTSSRASRACRSR